MIVFLRALVFLLAGLAVSNAFAQEVPLKQRMTAEEFRSTGLEKLTPAELARLESWLEGRRTETSGLAAPRDTARPRPERRTADLNKTRIKGTVATWDVGTVFELENGEAWEVVSGRSKLYRPLENPDVTLVPSLMGGWFLKFNADSDIAKPKVERIR